MFRFLSSDAEILSSVKLSDIISNKSLRAAFKEFLESEYSAGNLEFWQQCEGFKAIEDDHKRTAKAKAIYNKYLSPDSVNQINIPYQIRNTIHVKIQSGRTPEPSLFRTAQKNIHYMMENDSMSRFVKNAKYTKLIVKHARRAAFRNLFFNISQARPETQEQFRDSLRLAAKRSSSLRHRPAVDGKYLFSCLRRASSKMSQRLSLHE